MSYDAQEKLGSGAQPYELYLFQGVGVFFALTSADEQITYLGNVYTPATIERGEVDLSNEVVSGQIQIHLPKNHPLAQLLLPYLPPSPISLIVYGSHYGDSETVALFTGQISSARFTDDCELVCNSDQYLLQRRIPAQLYQSPCAHVFGDAGCTVNLGAHTYAGTITAIDSTGTVLTIPAFASLADPLVGGYLTTSLGARVIVAQSGNTVTIISGISGLAVGQTVFGVAGCALTFAACVHYKNIANFLGFDLIPILNPYDGSASIA